MMKSDRLENCDVSPQNDQKQTPIVAFTRLPIHCDPKKKKKKRKRWGPLPTSTPVKFLIFSTRVTLIKTFYSLFLHAIRKAKGATWHVDPTFHWGTTCITVHTPSSSPMFFPCNFLVYWVV